MTMLYALQRSYSWEDGGVHCDSLLLSEEHCQSNHWSLQISLFRELKACYPCLAWMNYLKILFNKINVAFTIEIPPSNVHNSKANLAWLLCVPLHSKQISWPRKKEKKTLTESHRHFPHCRERVTNSMVHALLDFCHIYLQSLAQTISWFCLHWSPCRQPALHNLTMVVNSQFQYTADFECLLCSTSNLRSILGA